MARHRNSSDQLSSEDWVLGNRVTVAAGQRMLM